MLISSDIGTRGDVYRLKGRILLDKGLNSIFGGSEGSFRLNSIPWHKFLFASVFPVTF